MIIKHFLPILLTSALVVSGCRKVDIPASGQETPAPEAIGSYTFDSKEYPIYTGLYAYDGRNIMVRVSPLDRITDQSTYAIIGINSSLEGREIDVEKAWHNDDYYFRYEDPVKYYSEYRKLHSGKIFIQRKGGADNVLDVKVDLILPDGTDFKLQVLSAEFEPYPQAID